MDETALSFSAGERVRDKPDETSVISRRLRFRQGPVAPPFPAASAPQRRTKEILQLISGSHPHGSRYSQPRCVIHAGMEEFPTRMPPFCLTGPGFSMAIPPIMSQRPRRGIATWSISPDSPPFFSSILLFLATSALPERRKVNSRLKHYSQGVAVATVNLCYPFLECEGRNEEKVPGKSGPVVSPFMPPRFKGRPPPRPAILLEVAFAAG